jgi:NAD(P)-dependent dehydrogenase (short-subunit alcohol dehydrogenase family)
LIYTQNYFILLSHIIPEFRMSKVILITGASSGIGLAMATYLAGRDYIVYGGSRSTPENDRIHVLRLDISDAKSVNEAITRIMKERGRIDALINNAGVGVIGSVEKTPMEDIRKAFEVNVFGTVTVCQAVLPVMRAQKHGKIINISSLGSAIGMPYRGFYSSAKASIDIITEALRFEVAGFGIQACTVHPGDVNTGMAEHRIMSVDFDEPAYGRSIKKALESINAAVIKGKNPADFGPFIEKLILAKRLKRSYFVGSITEELGIHLKKFMPSSSYEAMLKSHFESKD